MRRHTESIQDSLRDLNEALQRAEQRKANNSSNRAPAVRTARPTCARPGSSGCGASFSAPCAACPFRLLPGPAPTASSLPVTRCSSSARGTGRRGSGPSGARGSSAAELSGACRPIAWRLRVEGHTDAGRGLDRRFDNWELSSGARRQHVAPYRALGLPDERLEAVGLADTRPLDAAANVAAHRRNRRIEIHLGPAHPADVALGPEQRAAARRGAEPAALLKDFPFTRGQ